MRENKNKNQKVKRPKIKNSLPEDLRSKNPISEEVMLKAIPWVLQQLSQFAYDTEIVAGLQVQFQLTAKEAQVILDSVKKTHMVLNPEYQEELLCQVKLASRTVARQLDELFAEAKTIYEKQLVMNLKLKNINTIRNLLPSQVLLGSPEGDNINKAIFEIFGINASSNKGDEEVSEDDQD